jgi:xanthine dehydrogenase accessory factor
VREVAAEIDRWLAEGAPVALATVIETWGSAPRRVGAKMAVSADRRVAGSVSGGCVEGAVIEAAGEVLKWGRPRLLRFGVADETAWAVGLSCGGTIDVFVEPVEPSFQARVQAQLDTERPAATVTVVAGEETLLGRKVLLLGAEGDLVGELGRGLDALAVAAARSALAEGRGRRLPLSGPESAEVFVDVLRPAPLLVIVGGVHIAIALVALARALGFRTIVVDPRLPFGRDDRFPGADRVVHDWPAEALGAIGLGPDSAVAVLTHDPKLDDPALIAALPSPAFYVGALGSKATQARRRQRLLEVGVTEEQLARLKAPIGLDLGGRSPEEIALAVLAEIIAVRNRRPE